MISSEKLYLALAADVVVCLSDDDRDGEADTEILSRALESAETLVRNEIAQAGYSANAELTPFLEDLAVTLTIENLFHRRREVVPGVWSQRANQVRAILGEIASGKRPIDGLSRKARIQSTPEDQDPDHRIKTLKNL